MREAIARRVVCAAIRADDGDLVLGPRHYDSRMWAQINARPDGEKFHHRGRGDQGFVDARGVYMDRHEAYEVAEAANQIVRPSACVSLDGRMQLFSEGLY